MLAVPFSFSFTQSSSGTKSESGLFLSLFFFLLRCFFLSHHWLKVTFMEHTDEAILPSSFSRAPIVSYTALVCVHVLFFYFFIFSWAQSCLHDLQPRRITDWERIRLERGAPWQPCGNLLSVLSLALSQIYCHSISDTPNKGTRPAIPCLFVKSPHLWGFQLKINFRCEWLARNKSFRCLPPPSPSLVL